MPDMTAEDRAAYLSDAALPRLMEIASELSVTRRMCELDARLAVLTEIVLRLAAR